MRSAKKLPIMVGGVNKRANFCVLSQIAQGRGWIRGWSSDTKDRRQEMWFLHSDDPVRVELCFSEGEMLIICGHKNIEWIHAIDDMPDPSSEYATLQEIYSKHEPVASPRKDNGDLLTKRLKAS